MRHVIHYYKGPINAATRMLQQSLAMQGKAHVTVYCLQEGEVTNPIALWQDIPLKLYTLLSTKNCTGVKRLWCGFKNHVTRLRMLLSVLVSSADILHIHQHTGLAVGVWWQVFRRGAVVYDAHDILHHEILDQKGFARSRRLERSIVERGAHIIAVCAGMQRFYRNLYPTAHVSVLPSLPPQQAKLVSGSGGNSLHIVDSCWQQSRVRLVYAGLIDEKRIPFGLIESVAAMPDALLDIYGYGYENNPYECTIRAYIERQQVSNVRLMGRYAPDAIIEILSHYHYLVMLFLLDSENMRFCLPNKFFQALLAELPMIVTAGSDLAKIIGESQAGLAVPYDGVHDLCQQLASLTEKSADYQQQKNHIRNLAARMLDYGAYKQQIIHMYEQAGWPASIEADGEQKKQ